MVLLPDQRKQQLMATILQNLSYRNLLRVKATPLLDIYRNYYSLSVATRPLTIQNTNPVLLHLAITITVFKTRGMHTWQPCIFFDQCTLIKQPCTMFQWNGTHMHACKNTNLNNWTWRYYHTGFLIFYFILQIDFIKMSIDHSSVRSVSSYIAKNLHTIEICACTHWWYYRGGGGWGQVGDSMTALLYDCGIRSCKIFAIWSQAWKWL